MFKGEKCQGLQTFAGNFDAIYVLIAAISCFNDYEYDSTLLFL